MSRLQSQISRESSKQKNNVLKQETCTGATMSSTYATRRVLRSNTSLRRDKTETNDKIEAPNE